MIDQRNRKWLFLGTGGAVTLFGLWFALRLLNPLAGVWEDEGTVCSFGLIGGGECANEQGERFDVGVRLGSNGMTFGDYAGTYEMLPGDGFVFRAKALIEASKVSYAAEQKSNRKAFERARGLMAPELMQSMRRENAGRFYRRFSRK